MLKKLLLAGIIGVLLVGGGIASADQCVRHTPFDCLPESMQPTLINQIGWRVGLLQFALVMLEASASPHGLPELAMYESAHHAHTHQVINSVYDSFVELGTKALATDPAAHDAWIVKFESYKQVATDGHQAIHAKYRTGVADDIAFPW